MNDDVAGRLIAGLEDVGSAAEPGRFTIDEDAARRKLAEYRLADPHGWLCQVIAAANLLRATTIAITVHVGVLRIEFDGEGVELDGMFGAVFASIGETPEQRRRNRARRKLALGLDALLGMSEPGSVEISNVSGRLHFHSNGTRKFEAQASEGPTRIRVRRGIHWPELDQVRARCRYFPGKLTIRGEPIALGLRHVLDDHHVGKDRWPIEDGATIGWYGWRRQPRSASMLWLLCDGVLVEKLALDGRGGEIAILDAPFRLDIGEAKIVRDAEFERLLGLFEAVRREHPRPIPSAPEPPEPAAPAKPKGDDGRVADLIAALPVFVFYGVVGSSETIQDLDHDPFVAVLVVGALLSLALGFWLSHLYKRR